MMAHACYLSYLRGREGRFRVQDQLGKASKTLFQKQKIKELGA
jgi:hypothetical protein